MISGFYTSVDRHKNNLKYRGYDHDGKKIYNSYRYRPELFLESKDKDAEWKSLSGKPLESVRFDSMSECTKFIKQYEDIPSFHVYGNERHIPAFIQSQFPNKVEYDKRMIDILYIDIETAISETAGFSDPEIAEQEILTIAVKSSRCDTYVVWGLKDYSTSSSSIPHIKKEYRKFDTEFEMLENFLDWWSDPENTPDVVTGWNTTFFDIPYIINRITRVLGETQVKCLSPWKDISTRKVMMFGKEKISYTISGIQSLDYLDLFKKFTLNTYGQQESYRLDNIGEVVLGQRKIDYSDVGGLKELYELDFQRFVDYNIVDVELIERFEDKLGLIELVFTLAYLGGVNYTDTLGTVSIWDSIIFRKLANKKIAVPPSKRSEKQSYPGGFVKEVIPGMYDWVMSFDLNSLYPNIIIQYNMSPETLIRHSAITGTNPDKILNDPRKLTEDDNLAVAANGAVFSKTKQGFLPEIIEELYNNRKKIKGNMLGKQSEMESIKSEKREDNHSKLESLEKEVSLLDTEQMAIKILMNSLYGALGNQYFRYFDINIAEGITLTGQLIIRWAEKHVNEWLSKDFLKEDKIKDRIIAIDTDSVYLNVKDVVDKFQPKNPVKFLSEFGSKAIEPMLSKVYQELADFTCAYKNTMVMSRECIADRAIWTAKKRYILNVHNNEGVQYSEPKIKMMGIEAIKSSTPKVCRVAMKEMFKIMLSGDEKKTQKAIELFKTHFKTLPAHDIASPRGVTSVTKYYDSQSTYIKGTPMHCRASLVYNKRLEILGLENKYKSIQNGDKIKFVFLKKENPTGENVVAFLEELPEELELSRYIDYEMQFQKVFLDPIGLILNAIKWSAEERSSLDDFFC